MRRAPVNSPGSQISSARTIRLRHEIARRVDELVSRPTPPPRAEITHRQLLLRVNSGLKSMLRLRERGEAVGFPIHIHTTYDPRVIRRVLRDADILSDLGIHLVCHHQSHVTMLIIKSQI